MVGALEAVVETPYASLGLSRQLSEGLCVENSMSVAVQAQGAASGLADIPIVR